MQDNHNYNLMNQLVEEHKSLWRIKNEYMTDAGDCADCKAVWEKMAKNKEENIVALTDLVKKHI